MAAHQIFGNATAQNQSSSTSVQSANAGEKRDANRFPRTRPLWNFKSPHMYSKLEQAALNVDGFAPDVRTMKSRLDYIVALRDFRILRLNKNMFAYFQRFNGDKADDVVFTDFTPFMANYIHLFELIEKEFRQDLAKEGIIEPDPADKDTTNASQPTPGNMFASVGSSTPAHEKHITNGIKPAVPNGPFATPVPPTPSTFNKPAVTPAAPVPSIFNAAAATPDASRSSKRKAEEQGDKDNPFGKRPAWGSDSASKPLASASAQKLNRFISESPNRPKAGVTGTSTLDKPQTENVGSTPFKFLKTMKSAPTTPKPAPPAFAPTQPSITNTGLAKSAFTPAASQPSSNIFNFGSTQSKPAEPSKPVEPSPQRPAQPSPQKPAASVPSFVFGSSTTQPAATPFMFGSSVGSSESQPKSQMQTAVAPSVFNFNAGGGIKNPFASSTSEAPKFGSQGVTSSTPSFAFGQKPAEQTNTGLGSSMFSSAPVPKPTFGGFGASTQAKTLTEPPKPANASGGLASSAFSSKPTGSTEASQSFFKPTYTAPTTPLKLFGASTNSQTPAGEPQTTQAFNASSVQASAFGGFQSTEATPNAPAASPFTFKPAESKHADAPAPTAFQPTGFKPTGFQPTGFKPTGVSGPTNFMAQFGQKAAKFEKERKEKAKDEDFDSDEDNEEEWEKNYEAKQAEKKKKFEEQLKSLAPPPKFGPAGGFDISRSASPAGSVLEGPRPSGPHLFSNLSAVNSPAAEQSEEEKEDEDEVEDAESEEATDGEEDEGDDEDEGTDDEIEGDTTEQDDTDVEQSQARTPVTRSLFARMAKEGASSSKPVNGVAASGKRKPDPVLETKSPEPEVDRSKRRRGSPEKIVNGDASSKRSLFDRITPRSPEKQTPKPSTNPTFTFTPATSTADQPGSLFNFSKATSTPQAADSSPVGAPTPTPRAPGFSFTPLAKPSTSFGAGGSFSFGKPSFGSTAENKSTDSSQTSAATASFGTGSFAPSFKATPGGFGTASFKFGAVDKDTPITSQAPSTTASPFIFPTPGGDSATPSRINTPSAITSADERHDDANDSEDAPSHAQADLVNFDSYLAENDILFETDKAKAFIHVKDPNQRTNKAQAWETKGVGPIVILKPKGEGKGSAFIVMKSHPAGRVLLNSYVKPSIKYELVGPKRVRFLIVDGKGVPESWLVQFSTEETAKEFALVCAKNK